MNKFLPFEWIVAVRFLIEGAAQTAMIIVGTSVGVGVIVFMSAMLTAIQGNFLDRILNTQAHIVVYQPDTVSRPLFRNAGLTELAVVQKPAQHISPIDQWQKTLQQVRGMNNIAVAAPVVSGNAQVVQGATARSLSIIGVEPSSYFGIVKVPSLIVSGSPELTTQNVLVGTDFARKMGAVVGDKIRITALSGQQLTLVIGGIFDLGNRGANERTAYVSLRTAQSMMAIKGGVITIEVTVGDPYAAETIAQEISATTGLTADSWIKTNAQFFTAMTTQRLSFTVINFFIALSVAFGIASVLVVSVVQRSKEIGILRAMGSSQGQILRIFVIQGGIVGLLGSVGGSMLGFLIVFLFGTFTRNADGTALFTITITPLLMIETTAVATLAGLAAAMVPAMNAAKLDPVVAIRG